jgi:hypothetical protein
MKKSEAILSILCGFLFGIVLGFLFAPIKKGIGNNSGNTTNNNYDHSDELEEY